MLKVQEFLGAHGLQALKDQLAIEVVSHPTEPLIILNYDQIDSPKSHPVVRECRGLTLERGTWKVVAKSFDRFFNWGEMADESKHFDWSDFLCQTKEDGSLIVLYHHAGTWRINTRGSFGLDIIRNASVTWGDLVRRRLGNPQGLDPSLTYVCELVSPVTTVVRKYPQTELYLLTTFSTAGEHPTELPDEESTHWAEVLKIPRPRRYAFGSQAEIYQWLREQESIDPTFEGVVVRDRDNHRWKIKSRSYLGFNGVIDDKSKLGGVKFYLPFILNGEDAEFLAYFPQVADSFAAVKAKIEAEYRRLCDVWAETKDIPEQKAFAQAIQKRSPFVALLFGLRKEIPAERQTEADLRRLWRTADEMILKWFPR